MRSSVDPTRCVRTRKVPSHASVLPDTTWPLRAHDVNVSIDAWLFGEVCQNNNGTFTCKYATGCNMAAEGSRCECKSRLLMIREGYSKVDEDKGNCFNELELELQKTYVSSTCHLWPCRCSSLSSACKFLLICFLGSEAKILHEVFPQESWHSWSPYDLPQGAAPAICQWVV